MTNQSKAARTPPAFARPRDRRLSTNGDYGFGAVAEGVIIAGLSGAVLQIYLNQVLGLPALWSGTIIMVSLISDAIIDPLIGFWSDRVRSRWGRRHPLMYAAAVPTVLFFILLWNAPNGLSVSALVVFTVVIIVAARIATDRETQNRNAPILQDADARAAAFDAGQMPCTRST